MAIQQRVAPWKIQKLFNEGRYWKRVQSGELREVVQKNQHRSAANASAALPFCTHSQMIDYLDQHDKKVAIVHQYLLPDNTIGASGRPDPKMLVHKGVRYQVRIS